MRDQIRDLIERAAVLPQAMQAQHQWLVWRFVTKPGQDKPSKMPYYVNGNLRGWPRGRPKDGKATEAQPQVDQGHALDREHLVSLPRALDALKAGRWDGLGFAFLPGDGLIGIDVDHAIDADGVVADHCAEIIQRCASYTELSPSGTGVHVIVSGDAIKTFKSNDVGVEVFCGRQFFTVTAHPCGAEPQVQRISAETLDWLHVMVKGVPMGGAPAAPARAAQQAQDPTKPDDFSRVNRMALAMLDAWVPSLFPTAKRSDRGYRVLQADLGRDSLQEDLSITSMGIVDYGVHDMGDAKQGKRTAIDLVMEWKGLRAGEALRWLADKVGIRLEPLRPSGNRSALPPAPPITDEVPEGGPPGGLQEPDWLAASSPPPSPEQPAARGRKRGKGGPDDAQQDEEYWARIDAVCQRFRLIESTDQAWDTLDFAHWRVPNMRLRFGQDAVKGWLHRVATGRALTVKARDMVFEPGQQVPEHQINMFDGLPVEPAEGDVAPMLKLLNHLCAESSDNADEVDNIVHWLLCWAAYPLQHIGAKMQTAIVMHGPQGTGKNLFWDTVRDMYGSYGITVGQTEIEDKFNGWISRKLFVIGDEVVSRQEMYHNKNRLKSVVTQGAKFAIRGMMQETRWESNHANVVFLSNESQPLALEERDRRYMVIYTPVEADVQFYEEVRDFLANGGLAKLMHYLQTYPLGDFTPHTKPVMTKAKRGLIELNWRPAERFANEWLAGYLDLPFRACTAEQLYRAFKRWADRQGERHAPSQAVFTTQVERFMKESVKRDESGRHEAPRLGYRVINLERVDGPSLVRKSARCWVPAGTGPREGDTWGRWAAECVDEFESHVAAFCRSPFGNPERGMSEAA